MKKFPAWRAEATQYDPRTGPSRYRVLDVEKGKAIRLTRGDVAHLAASAPDLARVACQLAELGPMASKALQASGDLYLSNQLRDMAAKAEAVVRALRVHGVPVPY